MPYPPNPSLGDLHREGEVWFVYTNKDLWLRAIDSLTVRDSAERLVLTKEDSGLLDGAIVSEFASKRVYVYADNDWHLLWPQYPDLAITSFSCTPPVREVGETISSVLLKWTYSRSDISAQTITYSGNSVDVPIGKPDLTVTGSFSSNTTFQLRATDSSNNTVVRSAYLSFKYKRFWGLDTRDDLDEAGIESLNGELATSRIQTREVRFSGRYLWFAWPNAWGSGTVWVNGSQDTSVLRGNISITNAYGVTENYLTTRSREPLGGSQLMTVEIR